MYQLRLNIYKFGCSVLLLGLVSCLETIEIPEVNSAELTVKLLLATSEQTATRVEVPSTSDAYIDGNIAVLVFDNAGYYQYVRNATPVSTNQTEYVVSLMQSEQQQTLVFLANCSSLTSELYGFSSTTTLDALEQLVISKADAWSSSEPRIPMYGIAEKVTVSNITSPIPCRLIRMLACIDISLNTNVKNFSLKSASLYRRNTEGYLAYKNNAAYWNSQTKKALKPWIPAKAQVTKGPLTYSVPPNGNGHISPIYAFESNYSNQKDAATCLVVGGYFNGSNQETYYRVDIPYLNTNGTTDYSKTGELRRNYKYNVEIQHVKSAGSGTEEEALEGKMVTSVAIAPWSSHEMLIALPESEYKLDVERPIRSYDGTAKDRIVEIFSSTNWTASSNVNWITGIPTGVQTSENRTLNFHLSAHSNGNARTGIITIVNNDGLKKKVTITQYSGKAITHSKEGNWANGSPNDERKLHITKALFPWNVRVKSDDKLILAALTTLRGNQGNTQQTVTVKYGPVYANVGRATIAIYPDHDEFDEVTEDIARYAAYTQVDTLDVSHIDYGWERWEWVSGNEPTMMHKSCGSVYSETQQPWRLPTSTELAALMLYYKPKYSNAVYPPNTFYFRLSNYYWTSEKRLGVAWDNSRITSKEFSGDENTQGTYYRCVRKHTP